MTDRIAQLQKLLAADPGDAFCLYGLAQEHAKRGETVAAVEYYDRTLKADAAYCYAYYHKAKCQERAGDADAARATLEAGLRQARSCGDGHAAAEIEAYLDELS